MKNTKKQLKDFTIEELLQEYNPAFRSNDPNRKKNTGVIGEAVLEKIKTNNDYKQVFILTDFGNDLNIHCLNKFDITDVIDKIFDSVTLILTKEGLKRLNLN